MEKIKQTKSRTGVNNETKSKMGRIKGQEKRKQLQKTAIRSR